MEKIKASDVIVEEFGDPWICPQEHDVPLDKVIHKLEKDIRKIQRQPTIDTDRLQFLMDNFVKLLHILKQELKIDVEEWELKKETCLVKKVLIKK